MTRAVLMRAGFLGATGLAALVSCTDQIRSLHPSHSVNLRVTVRRSDTREPVPARVYLFKGDREFRLSPVDAMLPLRPDLFYRERLWRRTASPRVLEVTARDRSHFILLDGTGSFELPAAEGYRIQAFRGTSFRPAEESFSLEHGSDSEIELSLEPVAEGWQGRWLAADGHVHLVRAPEDDPIFLQWLQAEDLAVGNFLELQRQQHAAMQWGFGDRAEARAAGFSIRSGHESRSRFYGHTLFLGPSRMVEPLSIGLEYANSREAFPNPLSLFKEGRRLGALTGFAHTYGSQPNSTLLLNLVHESIDFVEIFQFGVLNTADWYELLNAGFRVVGLAGSDFPANLSRFASWPKGLPLLGPERSLVRAEAGRSAYSAWADGVRRGAVVVSNGPLIDFAVEGRSPGDTVEWDGALLEVRGTARAASFRPVESIEIIRNGEVVARAPGDGTGSEQQLDFRLELRESSWLAARVTARAIEGEPEIQAHTNPVYWLRGGAPVRVDSAREAIRTRWREEAAYYLSGSLEFPDNRSRREFEAAVEETSRILQQ